jgi:hypothetical protein
MERHIFAVTAVRRIKFAETFGRKVSALRLNGTCASLIGSASALGLADDGVKRLATIPGIDMTGALT